jgi:PAS domain S-box-containing protein
VGEHDSHRENRTEVERALDLQATAETRYRAALDGMTDGFYIFDFVEEDGHVVDFRLAEVNAAGLKRLSKTRTEILGRLYSELHVTARSSGLLDHLISRVVGDNETHEQDLRVVVAGSAPRWIHFRAVRLTDGIAITSTDITDRRQIERERELHVAVANNMGEGLCLIRASDAAIVYTNPKFEQMFGYESGELLGKPIGIVETGGTTSTTMLREHIGATYELRGLRKGGQPIWCERTTSIVHDEEHGEVMVLVQADVSERKRAEMDRDGFFRLSLDMLCIAGFDGRFLRLNPAWEETLGWSTEELLATSWIDFVHPDDYAATVAEGRKIGDGGLTLAFENRYRCKSGEYRTLSWRAVPSFADGVIYATVRDVTQVRAGEAELRRSYEEREQLLSELDARRQDEHLRSLAEAIPQIVWTATPDGSLDYYNQQWFDYTGMTLAETQGWGWAPVLHPDDLENCIARWSEAVRTGADYEVEYRFKRACDGAYRWHLGRARPVRDPAGSIVKWFGTCTDIDDQRRAKDTLVEGQVLLEARVADRTAQLSTLNLVLADSLAEKEVLLKEIHHRVKNNLQVISSLLKLHARQVSEPSAKEAFSDSQDRVRAISLLHEQLYQSKSLSAVTVASYAEELIRTLLRASARGAVTVAIDAGSIALPMDVAVPFGLILNELVTNSLKHGFASERAEKPVLRVEARLVGEDVELVVADNGPGFPPTFDPKSASTLGVHLILTLVRQLHGTVQFASPGGAECRLRFPRASEGVQE